jgi:hypothetical protein
MTEKPHPTDEGVEFEGADDRLWKGHSKMWLHRLRARLDRLDQVIVGAFGEDPEKNRRCFALLRNRKLSGAALTGAEQAEFERLENFVHAAPLRRHSLLSKFKRVGLALTDAETAELARLDDFVSARHRIYLRLFDLSRQKLMSSLTDAEQNELAELEKSFDSPLLRVILKHCLL